MPSSKDTKRSKAPKIILPGTRRGARASATAPRKMSRSAPKAAQLAPGDPSAIQTATMPGPNGIGNTIETNANYTMGQEDRCVLVVDNGASIALSPEPLIGYPVFVVADGGIVTVTGAIQGGTQTIPQGSVGTFVYSDQSGKWSTSITAASPGVAGGNVVWKPGVASSGNRVATWAEVQTAIANAHNALVVYVDSSVAAAVVTAGSTTDCLKVTFRGAESEAGGVQVMQLPDTAILQNIYSIEGQLQVQCQCTTIPPLEFVAASGMNLIVRDGAAITLSAGCTLAPVQNRSSGTLQITFLDGGYFTNSAAATVPLIGISGSATVTFEVLSNYNSGLIPVNLVSGSAGTLVWQADDTAPLPAFTGFTGTITYTPISVAIGTLYNDALVNPQLGATTVQGAIDKLKQQNNATTVEIINTTGAVTLNPGETAFVDTTTGAISTITLGGGVLGAEYHVNDQGCACNTHNITVSPGPSGQLEDSNNPGVYQAAGVTSVFQTPGQFAGWKYDGTAAGAGKYKLISSGP